jgi:hypothetical protein
MPLVYLALIVVNEMLRACWLCPRVGGSRRTGLTRPSCAPSPPRANLVVLPGRATRVPHRTDTHGT